MILTKLNTFLVLLILFFASTSFCQNEYFDYKHVTQPFSRYFSPKEYNASASNWSIAQDRRGIMYFGNSRGLLEYDGISWRKIKTPFSTIVRRIAVDDTGKVFITAMSDFGYLEPDSIGQLKFLSLKKQLDKVHRIDKEFWDVAVNSKGVFFKTPDEIIRWDGKDFKIWDSVYAYRLYKIGDDIFSRNQRKGLMKIDGDSIYVIPDGDFFYNTGVFEMLPLSLPDQNHSGHILIVTNYKGLFIYDGKKNIPFQTEIDEFLFNNQIYDACLLNDGNIALATQRGGVAIIDREGKLVKFLNQNTGLPTNVVYDVYPDKRGGLWIATNEGIVFSEINSPLSLIPAEGQLRSQISSIIRYENKIYIANDIGVLILEHGKSKFELLKGSDRPAYQLLKLNDKLFAATNWGLMTIKENKFASELAPSSINSIHSSSLFPDLIYFGGREYLGIVKAEFGKSPVVKTVDVRKYEISSVVEDSDSTLWIIQYNQPISHITSKMQGFESVFGSDSIQIDNYSEIDGLPGNYWTLFNFEGRILLGTDKGIYKFDRKNQSFLPDSIFGADFTTPDYYILSLEKSNQGGYWILADVNDRVQLGKALLQKDGNYTWEPMPLFQRMDIEDIDAIYPDYDPDKDKEVLWISTSEGLVYYDPDIEKDLELPFLVLIRKVIVKSDSIVYAGSKTVSGSYSNVVIPFSQNDIRFEFSATSYEKSYANQYQYHLEGRDNGWSAWTTETKKDYTNLSSGNYVFRIRAKNIYGVISSEDSFGFRVLPPWYLTWLAYGIYSIFFSLLVFGVDRAQRRRLIAKERQRAEFREAKLRAEAAEAHSKLIKADNDRKTHELEEARHLQLSMLPKEIPILPNFDIAVYMKTATEVSGDYYDFSMQEDGSLNIALGDATGHGLKAGILVSAMKSLFTTNSSKMDIEEFFRTANSGIKNMNIQRMMMGFLVLNINRHNFRLINAGMPPIFLYRKESRSVEEIREHGIPIGAMSNAHFKSLPGIVNKGDVILLITDGLPELQHYQSGELYGYARVKSLFEDIAEKAPDEIIRILRNEGSAWLNDRDPEDDVTFMVIKIK